MTLCLLERRFYLTYPDEYSHGIPMSGIAELDGESLAVTIPLERSTQTTVPGRPGSLTQLEGDDVYDDMILTATCFIADPEQIPVIAAWLK